MATPRIDDRQRRARLVTRHRLAAEHRTDDVEVIADDLVALHSTDPVTVYLSAAARMATPSLGAVDRALYEDRTLLRHHAMRRTLWVFGHEHARLSHHAATVDVAAVQHRNLLAQLAAGGVDDPAGWLADARTAVHELLVAEGPMPARQVGLRLPEIAATSIPIGPGVYPGHARALLVMGFEGQVLRARPTGTWINGQYRWAAAQDWVPGGVGAPLDRRTAAAGLARAYLRAFGPATRDDLKWWAGWTVATTKAALADTGAVEVSIDEGTGYLLPDDVDDVGDPGPSVALLPGLDPTTMGWKARDFHLDPAITGEMFDRNGNGGPAVWVDGRIAGGWVQRRDGEIAVRMLADVGTEARDAVDAAAQRLRELLGDVRFTVRFRLRCSRGSWRERHRSAVSGPPGEGGAMTATHPAELAGHDLHGSWTDAPELDGSFDPFGFTQRMAAYRLMIEATNDGARFGADNRRNPLWGLMFQHQWQFRTGRLGPTSRDDGRIDPAAPWGYGNYVLCVVPWLGAIGAGTVTDAELVGPDACTRFDYAHGGGGAARYVPAVLRPGVADWRAYFEMVAAIPPGGDDERLRLALWKAHKTCLDVVAGRLSGDDPFHPPEETEFLRGWCRMVDFLWAAAWRTDFDSMTDHGLDVLPERMLGPGDGPGTYSDLPRKVRRNVRNVLGLARTTDRRYAVNLWLWQRVMRTRDARDHVLPLLDAVFDPRRDNRAEQLRLLRYLLRP